MRILGNLDLGNNFLQQARLELEEGFPTEAKPGRLLFNGVSKVLYICAELIEGLPIWIPLTKTRDTYKHVQVDPALEWTVNHNLDELSVFVQIYEEGKLIIPDQVIPVSKSQATVVFNEPTVGIAIVMMGDTFGSYAREILAYEQVFISSTSWVVQHDLNREVRISYFVNGIQVQPMENIVNANQTLATFPAAVAGVARVV